MTAYHNIKGYINWAKVYEGGHDTFNGEDRWMLQLVFADAEEEAKYDKLGLSLKKKEVEGANAVQFRRPLKKVISGEEQTFDAPKITQWSDSEEKYIPFTEAIGNGTLGNVNISVYKAGIYMGHRLEGVTVLKHVPYEQKTSEPVTGATNTAESTEEVAPW